MVHLSTPRLILRSWQTSDMAPFAAMNADEHVMEHFPSTLTEQESEAMMARIVAGIAPPFELWAVERKADGRFLGFTGLQRVTFEGPLQGRIEIDWRLCHDVWGQGYAPEAANACLENAAQFGLKEVVAFTALQNLRSQRVMQKIGMHLEGEFDHPALPAGHPLLRHVLYTIGL